MTLALDLRAQEAGPMAGPGDVDAVRTVFSGTHQDALGEGRAGPARRARENRSAAARTVPSAVNRAAR
ncbi:hypothetical protein [Streptomyces spinosus]|uniref:hypothetical protein n=1 Tax=Streptomyces spinosus TaxID=2872623 RepID=UPI0027E107FC|nr:hypothetical protein [Streptomyces spinosus]